jgi:hypothetical protein
MKVKTEFLYLFLCMHSINYPNCLFELYYHKLIFYRTLKINLIPFCSGTEFLILSNYQFTFTVFLVLSHIFLNISQKFSLGALVIQLRTDFGMAKLIAVQLSLYTEQLNTMVLFIVCNCYCYNRNTIFFHSRK